MKLTATFRPQSVTVTVNGAGLSVSTGEPVAREYYERPAYDGPYTFTPSAEAQIIPTQHKRMTENITIAPIPNNYGLITWNGAYLTVS